MSSPPPPPPPFRGGASRGASRSGRHLEEGPMGRRMNERSRTTAPWGRTTAPGRTSTRSTTTTTTTTATSDRFEMEVGAPPTGAAAASPASASPAWDARPPQQLSTDDRRYHPIRHPPENRVSGREVGVARGASASTRPPAASAVPEVFSPRDRLPRPAVPPDGKARGEGKKPPRSRSHPRASRDKAAAAASAAKATGRDRDSHELAKPKPRPEVASPRGPPETGRNVMGKPAPRPEVVGAQAPPRNPSTFLGEPAIPSADASPERRRQQQQQEGGSTGHEGEPLDQLHSSFPSSAPPPRSVRGRRLGGLLPFRGRTNNTIGTVRAWAVPAHEEEEEEEEEEALFAAVATTTPLAEATATRADDTCTFNVRNRCVQFVLGLVATVIVALVVGLGLLLSDRGGGIVSDGPQQQQQPQQPPQQQTEDKPSTQASALTVAPSVAPAPSNDPSTMTLPFLGNNIFQKPTSQPPTLLPTHTPTQGPTFSPATHPTEAWSPRPTRKPKRGPRRRKKKKPKRAPTSPPMTPPISPPTMHPTPPPTSPPTPRPTVPEPRGIGLCWVRTLLTSIGSSATGHVSFGNALAVSGSTLAVGAPEDDLRIGGVTSIYKGSVTVYNRTGSGWSLQQKIFSSDGLFGDWFGSGVSVDGNTIVVGACNNERFRGAVYVFNWDGSEWKEHQKIVPDDSSEGDRFGLSVVIHKGRIIVGAPQDRGSRGRGKAYVFTLKGQTWTEEAKLIPGNGVSNDAMFGESVVLNDLTAMIGAPVDDTDKGTGSGSVFVYEYVASADAFSSPWKEVIKLLPKDGSEGDRFGGSLFMLKDGSKAIIGARRDASQGFTNSGSAYTFVRDSSSWMEESKLLPNDGAEHDYFGVCVGLVNDTVAVVGAYGDDNNGINSGSLYLLLMEEDGRWSQKAEIVPPDGKAGDDFGFSLAMDDNIVVVGTYFADKVYIYEMC